MGYLNADTRHIPLADGSVHMIVTSPPYYGLRDYNAEGQIGLETTPQEYVQAMVQAAREWRRVLRDDGTLWINLGDTYANDAKWGGHSDGKNYTSTAGGYQTCRNNRLDTGLPGKNMLGIPWRVAFALQDDGWYLRSDIIWAKPNAMPESVTDRPTKAHEYVFLLSKSPRYFYDHVAVREEAAPQSIARIQQATFAQQTGGPKDYGVTGVNPARSMRKALENFAANPGRNKRTVWTVSTSGSSVAHFAMFPPALIEPMIKAGTSERGVCPVCGAPWERVIERPLTAHDGDTQSAYANGTTANRLAMLRQAARQRGEEYSGAPKTTGWRPTCDCPPRDPVPAVVLDPFVGAGTTVMVARNLGRRAVGLDISYPYLRDIARPRTSTEFGLTLDTGRTDTLDDLPLFAGGL